MTADRPAERGGYPSARWWKRRNHRWMNEMITAVTSFGDGTAGFVGPVELVFTCDWGGCNDPAVTVRWSRSVGWLSVCGTCERTPHAPEQRARSGGIACPVCGSYYLPRQDGSLRHHRRRIPGREREGLQPCPGRGISRYGASEPMELPLINGGKSPLRREGGRDLVDEQALARLVAKAIDA